MTISSSWIRYVLTLFKQSVKKHLTVFTMFSYLGSIMIFCISRVYTRASAFCWSSRYICLLVVYRSLCTAKSAGLVVFNRAHLEQSSFPSLAKLICSLCCNVKT